MSTQTATPRKPAPEPRNGVDTPTLFATINVVAGQPELAKFQFRATNRWKSGTHSMTRIESFSGAGGWYGRRERARPDGEQCLATCAS